MTEPTVCTDANFELLINSNKVVLMDFYANWCGPCKTLSPILDQLAKDYEGKAVISKLDVDANAVATMKYNVRSLPILILFKEGEEVQRFVGMTLATTLCDALDAQLNT